MSDSGKAASQMMEWDARLKISLSDLVGGGHADPIQLSSFPAQTRIGVFYDEAFFQEDRDAGVLDFYRQAPLTGFDAARNTAIVDLNRLHESGASRVTEMAWFLACIEHFKKQKGFNNETLIDVHCSTDEQVFLSTAFLRALRFGVTANPIQISALTSLRCFSRLDPWNNALRASSSSTAALWGGADVLFTRSFDAVTGGKDHFGHRLARNTGLILQSEAGFQGLNDPAGGSFAIETITHALISEARALLPRLLDQGFEVLVHEDLQSFESEYGSGHRVLLGVNRFQPDDKKMGEEVQTIKNQVRFARTFEDAGFNEEAKS